MTLCDCDGIGIWLCLILKWWLTGSFYLCNINRLDLPEEVHLVWQSTEYSNYMSNCQDRIDRGLNSRRTSNEFNALPLIKLQWLMNS